MHPHEYSIPSQASSQWHFGVLSTKTPISCPMDYERVSSSSKSTQPAHQGLQWKSFINSCCIGILFSHQGVSWELGLSMNPRFHRRTWSRPFALLTHPSAIFGFTSSMGKPCSCAILTIASFWPFPTILCSFKALTHSSFVYCCFVGSFSVKQSEPYRIRVIYWIHGTRCTQLYRTRVLDWTYRIRSPRLYRTRVLNRLDLWKQ